MTEVVVEFMENVKVHLADEATGKHYVVGMVTRYGDGEWRAKTKKAGSEESGFPNRESAICALLRLYETDLAAAVRSAQADYDIGMRLLDGVAR